MYGIIWVKFINESLGDPLIRAENKVVTFKPSKPEQVRTCVGKWSIVKYVCLMNFSLGVVY